MTKKETIICDGNTAAANIAYAFSEVAAIYPITPSSPMGELADQWAAQQKKNLFNQTVDVIEMQSEAGASGAIHGSLTGGALTTTFTASQGLLLMLPNLHKIAGELLPCVMHVASRSLAAQALSIFGDHSDVMSARNTGFGLVSAASVQEVQDLAVISHSVSPEARIPFINFFDGFRTSHELQKIETISEDILREFVAYEGIKAFKANSLNPEHPIAKVGAENPDVYFQGRESVNKFYDATPELIKKRMTQFEQATGRSYHLFDYIGAPDAEKIIIAMGSANETIHETIDYLVGRGEKVGAIKVRVYRPFSVPDFLGSLPQSVKEIAVLDRTKEPGSIGEPLYLDVLAALQSRAGKEQGFGNVQVIGGRYGLSSKEFNPSHVKAVFDHLTNKGFHGFTVGINDDVTHLSIPLTEHIESAQQEVVNCKFWGYGSDGTVSANKNSIKIIGQETNKYVQGYFSYDSKKSGGVTVSHLRFSNEPIRSTYLLTKANFVALHKPEYIGKYDILENICKGGTFLLNCTWNKDEVFSHLTANMQQTIRDKNIRFYIINANAIAEKVGLGTKISTAMQTAFFKVSGILPEDEAIDLMKKAVEKQFKRKGERIVSMNWQCIDEAKDATIQVNIPQEETNAVKEHQHPTGEGFIHNIINPISQFKGDNIPVSAMPVDGTVPTGTTQLEKRGIANKVPKWLPEKCIQCGICSMVCPHAAIRTKQIQPKDLEGAPQTFTTLPAKGKHENDLQFKVQVYPEDCTGCEACGNCITQCPVGALVPNDIAKERAAGENENQRFFDKLPDNLEGTNLNSVKGSQLKTPLFEFSGACAGCGETAYIKVATQLFGDNMMIANATGCSSIFGGTFPTIPYTTTPEGKGPAWANSLFEDNAEYGYGFRLAVDANRKQLKELLEKVLRTGTTQELTQAISNFLPHWERKDDETKDLAKQVTMHLSQAVNESHGESQPILTKINNLKDYLLEKSIWIIGGDGWAYDIGFGGLDHVLASGKNVNVLVLDTEVYSNTGGQCSKATPRGATAKFAISGKEQKKKDLGAIFRTYENIYVASINLGANMAHVVKTMIEAESYNGPSIIIAYAPCIAHGIDMKQSVAEEKQAVKSGYWPLYRYDPRRIEQGENPFLLDAPTPNVPFADFINNEIRYKALKMQFPKRAEQLFKEAEQDAVIRRKEHEKLAEDRERKA
ncbi:pyruvate:ferredoxin (flavodoxin) oxidoreductase [Candidatus Woesearchaeota archaeon]|nr:pyruvate:ferredoxin (flavodoxin) oxidoreductase [Candidatus Woesearchaeota archaeon]